MAQDFKKPAPESAGSTLDSSGAQRPGGAIPTRSADSDKPNDQGDPLVTACGAVTTATSEPRYIGAHGLPPIIGEVSGVVEALL